MTYTYQDGILYFYFSGDLDHLHVSRMKEQCIQLIEKYQPKQVKMDFQAVSFVDSTGIGFVLAHSVYWLLLGLAAAINKRMRRQKWNTTDFRTANRCVSMPIDRKSVV